MQSVFEHEVDDDGTVDQIHGVGNQAYCCDPRACGMGHFFPSRQFRKHKSNANRFDERQPNGKIIACVTSVEELEKRLLARATDSPEKIRMRVEKAKEEIKLAESFDHIVINDILENAQDDTLRIVSEFLAS